MVKGLVSSTVEWDFVDAAGRRVKLEISARLIEHGQQVVEVEGIARDITERKELEREILEISNREQRRIGHDLHDGVCQQLAGIAFMTDTLAETLQEKGAPESSQAGRISSLINAAIRQTRGVAQRGLALGAARGERAGLRAGGTGGQRGRSCSKINRRFVCEEPLARCWTMLISAGNLYYIVKTGGRGERLQTRPGEGDRDPSGIGGRPA